MKRVLQSCSILLLLCTAAAHAQLYKWVGPDGKVTYSDMPPPSTATRVEANPVPGADSGGDANLPFELAEAVRNRPVTLYSTRDCAPCNEGRKLLSERGIPFTEKTVNTNEDIKQFRQVGGDSQLPLLTIGEARERGFEAGAWNTALSAAGYPETSMLPPRYRNPPPVAAAQPPASVAVIPPAGDARATAGAETQTPAPLVTELPPALGNAPPGFRF